MWVYVIKADSHLLLRSPLIGPRGVAGRGTGGVESASWKAGTWDLDLERGVLYKVYTIADVNSPV